MVTGRYPNLLPHFLSKLEKFPKKIDGVLIPLADTGLYWHACVCVCVCVCVRVGVRGGTGVTVKPSNISDLPTEEKLLLGFQQILAVSRDQDALGLQY